MYSHYRQCLITNYADVLADPGVKDLRLIDRLPAAINARKVDAHLREMVADFWGTQALVECRKNIWGLELR